MTQASDDANGGDEGHDDERWTLVRQTKYEEDGIHDLTTTIIAAIADAEGVSPVEVKDPVLYDCVDVASLEDAFFGSDVSGQNRDGIGTVEFQFGDYRITVNSNGWISVCK